MKIQSLAAMLSVLAKADDQVCGHVRDAANSLVLTGCLEDFCSSPPSESSTSTAAPSSSTTTPAPSSSTTSGAPGDNSIPVIGSYFGNWYKWRSPTNPEGADYSERPCMEEGNLDCAANLKTVTHVYHAFTDLKADGSLVFLEPEADPKFHEEWVALKKTHGFKYIASIGGWTRSTFFGNVAADPAVRSSFVQNVIAYIKEYDLDGIDFDWEYPVMGGCTTDCQTGAPPNQSDEDWNNYIAMAGELRSALDAEFGTDPDNYKEIGMALGMNVDLLKSARELTTNNVGLGGLCQHMDKLLLMSYDMHGPWSTTTGHNAPLFHDKNPLNPLPEDWNLDTSIQEIMSQGCAASKLHMGLPSYGRCWGGVSQEGEYVTSDGTDSAFLERVVDYFYARDVLIPEKGWTSHYNDISKVAYIYGAAEKEWCSIPSVQEMKDKMAYAKEKGFAGFFFWEMSGDIGDHGVVYELQDAACDAWTGKTCERYNPDIPAGGPPGWCHDPSPASNGGCDACLPCGDPKCNHGVEACWSEVDCDWSTGAKCGADGGGGEGGNEGGSEGDREGAAGWCLPPADPTWMYENCSDCKLCSDSTCATPVSQCWGSISCGSGSMCA